MNDKYKDIIHLEHPDIINHERMTMEQRAAQFAPFAALTGYDEEVKETGRETSKKIEINEDVKEELDLKLQIINKYIKDKPQVEITYFIKDNKKTGGEYITELIRIKKIDSLENIIITIDKNKISIEDIIDIKGDIFNETEREDL